MLPNIRTNVNAAQEIMIDFLSDNLKKMLRGNDIKDQWNIGPKKMCHLISPCSTYLRVG
jgi:hypothetical protein